MKMKLPELRKKAGSKPNSLKNHTNNKLMGK
jgi:hypothetical protein